ncbi:ribbon-helix-helix protein, CopG family [Tsukamurella asaccharolytica]|uniref:Ribbon-helix-helix protein, CopG family n=1 Tax=Tsukamurella asaccharolytica TaxID=2592067 RepID=A0A5C5RF48_9ACTN|nr:ribbon-helix-helix protein, CopG family [Tsukamurella asaccharolytica]
MSDQSDRRATKVRLELRLDPPVAEQLQELAAEEQRTVSAVAQRLLVGGMTAEVKEEQQS